MKRAFGVLITSAKQYISFGGMFHSSADDRLTSTADIIIEKRPCYQISAPLHFSSSFDIVCNFLLSIRIDSYLRMYVSTLPLIILLIIVLIAVPLYECNRNEENIVFVCESNSIEERPKRMNTIVKGIENILSLLQ